MELTKSNKIIFLPNQFDVLVKHNTLNSQEREIGYRLFLKLEYRLLLKLGIDSFLKLEYRLLLKSGIDSFLKLEILLCYWKSSAAINFHFHVWYFIP